MTNRILFTITLISLLLIQINSATIPTDYVGCLIDSATNRDLASDQGGHATNEACFQICKATGFRYAGLQNGGECYCDNDFGKYGFANDNDCNDPCVANPTEICGGFLRNSVYDLQPQPHGVYLGCYADETIRDLVNYQGSNFTQEQCFVVCDNLNFRYAALQYYGQCYCDNVYGKYAKKAKSQCNTQCSADKTESCGGGYRNSIFDLQFGVAADIPSQYVGCLIDTGNRDLRTNYGVDNQNHQQCFQKCVQNGFRYAGLQNGGQCFCDNNYGKYGYASENDCNYVCDSNHDEKCGGQLRNSVYDLQP